MHRFFITIFTCCFFVVSGSMVTGVDANAPDLLTKHRAAIGSDDVLRSLQTMRTKLHYSMMMLEGTIETVSVAPDKSWMNLKTDIIGFTEASDGTNKWKLDQNGQLTQNNDETKLKMPNMVLGEYQYLFPNSEITITDGGTVEVDGQSYRVLEIMAPGYKKTRTKYLDPETFLCMFEETEEEGISVKIEYTDFQVHEGLTIPWKSTQNVKIPGMPPSTMTIEEVSINQPVDLVIFNAPESEEKDYHFPESNMVTVPMKRHGDHLMIEVMINAQGPYTFLLDSGAASTIIDKSFADELGLERVGGMHAVGIGGTEEIDSVEVKGLSVGEFRIDDLKLFCMDFKELGSMLGLDDSFKGIVGYDLFARAVMKLDYQNQQLTIIDSETFDYDGPGKPVQGEILNNLICVDGVLDGDIEGKIRIDTGAAGGIHLHAGFLKEKGVLDRYKGDVEVDMYGAGGGQTIQLVKVESLKLGEFEVKTPSATLMQSKDGETGIMGTLEAIGTAGTEILSKFVVYFDYERNRLILEPTRFLDKTARKNRAGIVLTEDEPGIIIVAAVFSGSPGDKAGFKLGDKVLRMSRLKAGAGLTASIGNRMLFSTADVTYTFKIERDGRHLSLDLVLSDLAE